MCTFLIFKRLNFVKKYNTVITHGKPTQRGKHAQEVEIQQKCNFLASLGCSGG